MGLSRQLLHFLQNCVFCLCVKTGLVNFPKKNRHQLKQNKHTFLLNFTNFHQRKLKKPKYVIKYELVKIAIWACMNFRSMRFVYRTFDAIPLIKFTNLSPLEVQTAISGLKNKLSMNVYFEMLDIAEKIWAMLLTCWHFLRELASACARLLAKACIASVRALILYGATLIVRSIWVALGFLAGSQQDFGHQEFLLFTEVLSKISAWILPL